MHTFNIVENALLRSLQSKLLNYGDIICNTRLNINATFRARKIYSVLYFLSLTCLSARSKLERASRANANLSTPFSRVPPETGRYGNAREQFSSHLGCEIVTSLPVAGRRRDWKLDPIARAKM